jgi:hypothetical protein
MATAPADPVVRKNERLEIMRRILTPILEPQRSNQ